MTPTRTPTKTPAADKSVEVRLNRAFTRGELPKDLLIVGPAGSGKTLPVLTFLHRLAADHPNLRILVCRQTRASLTSSVLVTYEQEVLPADGMSYLATGARRANRQSYAYPGGSEIVLGGLDRPDRVLSTAWDIIYFNEAIEGDEGAWDTLASRLGRPGRVPWLGNLIGDTNPGDPSHWLKKRVDDGRTVGWYASHRANPAMWDGAAWTPAGEAYNAQLDRLRGTRRKRLKEGLWAAGEGQWFETFGQDEHVTPFAEYHPGVPVHLAIDSGVHTAAVWFQVRPGSDGPLVTVFADYYAFNVPAYEAAVQVLALGRSLPSRGRIDRATTDPAGKSSTPVGPTVSGEYLRAGLRPEYWPSFSGSVNSGLTLIESFVSSSPPALLVHPRCENLQAAFANYKRAKRAGQYIDRPEDPQHPYEDVMDALRGGLQDKFPDGRRPGPGLTRIAGTRVF